MIYYVESSSGWFCTRATTARLARREGVSEFGRGNVDVVRKATDWEIAAYIELKSEAALEPEVWS